MEYSKKMNDNYIDTLKKAIFAGIAISFGCIAFLTMGKLIGPLLFTFGLITVVHYKLSLYTGSVGFLELLGFNSVTFNNWKTILIIILGNIIGCLIVAILASFGGFTFAISASSVVESRLSQPILSVIVRAMGCGLIMTTAVKFAREGRFLPLLFGVPLFIYCGFYHSIADTFYYAFSSVKPTFDMVWHLFMTYLGNYFGCSAYKIFLKK